MVPVGGRPITPSAMVELDEAEPAAAFAAVGEAIAGAHVEEGGERGDPPSRLGAVARERDARRRRPLTRRGARSARRAR